MSPLKSTRECLAAHQRRDRCRTLADRRAAEPLAAAGVIGVALNGVFVLSWSTGYANGYSGWIVLMAAAVALALIGPGRFAVDAIIAKRTAGPVRQWLAGPRGMCVAIALGLAVGLIVMNVFGPGFDSVPNFPEFPPSG